PGLVDTAPVHLDLEVDGLEGTQFGQEPDQITGAAEFEAEGVHTLIDPSIEATGQHAQKVALGSVGQPQTDGIGRTGTARQEGFGHAPDRSAWASESTGD